MMSPFVLALVLGLTPADCESPPVRDVSALQSFAQKSGALSVSLDSVATWCFESGGEWRGGAAKKAKAQAAPVGDCAKALGSCETAKTEVTAAMRQLLNDALADLERPFLGKKYVPKRGGLADRPSQAVNCSVRSRPELFAQAQARMDLARMASQAHAEYANYKTWLYAEGLKCSQAARSGKPDATQTNIAIDAAPAPAGALPNPDQSKTVMVAVERAPSSTPAMNAQPVVDAGRPLVVEGTPSRPAGGPSSERERMMALSPVERWAALTQARSRLELDRDYTLGFLASRELRDCRCQRPNPAGLARRYAQNEDLAELAATEAKNVQCEVCLQDAFAAWKVRLERQCALVGNLSDFEVGVLQRSDDGNGLPPRCFDAAMARRGFDAGAVTAPPPRALAPPVDASAAKPSSVLAVSAPAPAFTGSPLPAPAEWAPIPVREEGRLYVRLFMSSGCAADVLPGPIQARTGDLLVIPYNARQLSVRSPCGGVAEVYWGREVKPRVSEAFGRNQPLHLQFQPQ